MGSLLCFIGEVCGDTEALIKPQGRHKSIKRPNYAALAFFKKKNTAISTLVVLYTCKKKINNDVLLLIINYD